MGINMIKFPSIEQSRQVLPSIIRTAQFTHIDSESKEPVYNTSAPLPILEFRGSIKLHGSNAAIVQTALPATTRNIHFQSRNRILSVQEDLNGFCVYMNGQQKAVDSIFQSISNSLKGSTENEKEIEAIAVFGEWCGTGIQNAVAISELPKMFVIFAVQVIYPGEKAAKFLDMSKLLEVKAEKARIFNIMQFPTFSLVIDFNKEENIEEAKAKMDELTLDVEEECPVGKHFGISGIGEGIVWQAIQSPSLPVFKAGRFLEPGFWFKTKGVKHSSYRRPARSPKQGPSLETKTKADAFVELVVTPARLQQGLQVLEWEMLLPIEMKSLGAFIKWVIGDVMKEEYDRVEEAGLDGKALAGPIAAVAKEWYISHLGEARVLNAVKGLKIAA